MQDVDSFRVVEGTKEKNFVERISSTVTGCFSNEDNNFLQHAKRKWLKDTYDLPKIKTRAFCHLHYSLICRS